jgi:hypothetical protein
MAIGKFLVSRLGLPVSTVVVFLLAQGCGASWQVIRVSGPPSALRGAKEVSVNFDYSLMSVEGMSESAWVASKLAEDPKYQLTWFDLKSRFQAAVIEGFVGEARGVRIAANAAPTGVVLIVQVKSFKLGKYIPFAMPHTSIYADLTWQVNGQTTDVINLERSQSPSIYSPSVFNHIGPVGNSIGSAAGEFLNTKVAE